MLINLTAQHINTINFMPYIDWRIWTMLFVVSLACLVLSHSMKRGNEIYMILAVVFAGASLFGSFSVADYTGQIVNGTAIHYSIYDLSSIWMSIIFGVYFILTVLNIIYVWVEIVMKRELPLKTDEQIAKERIFRHKPEEMDYGQLR